MISDSHLDLNRATYIVYGVGYIDLVSLARKGASSVKPNGTHRARHATPHHRTHLPISGVMREVVYVCAGCGCDLDSADAGPIRLISGVISDVENIDGSATFWFYLGDNEQVQQRVPEDVRLRVLSGLV